MATAGGGASHDAYAYNFEAIRIAGSGVSSFSDGAAAQATFSAPGGLLRLPEGGLLIADTNNNALRLLRKNSVVTVGR